MKNTFRDLTVNVKKSIDREYNGDSNMEPNYNDNQKMLDDNVISSIESSYDDDYEDYDIIVDSIEDDISIEPDRGINIDSIKLVKIKSLKALSDELDNVNSSNIPALIDLKYLQERRLSEFNQVGSTIKAYKSATKNNVILLGSTGNVILVSPADIRLIKE